jgi:hypothetical protein
MVYRSLGKEVPQAQIWPAIAKPNRAGNLASTTHLMAQDALTRGFSAIAIQVRHPLQALRICRHYGVRAILNHRLQQDAPTGHYSVMVGLDEENVVLHDPYYGAARNVPHAKFLELWQRRFPNSEIVGNMLIGVAAQPAPTTVCQVCQTPIPSTAKCPKCPTHHRLLRYKDARRRRPSATSRHPRVVADARKMPLLLRLGSGGQNWTLPPNRGRSSGSILALKLESAEWNTSDSAFR